MLVGYNSKHLFVLFFLFVCNLSRIDYEASTRQEEVYTFDIVLDDP